MLCISELRGLEAIHDELSDLGVQILAVSVDPAREAQRIVEKNGLSFPILCDTSREVIRAFGLVHENGGLDGSDIPIPAHVLIDRDGRIVSRHLSRRAQDRIHPAEVLSAAREFAEGRIANSEEETPHPNSPTNIPLKPTD